MNPAIFPIFGLGNIILILLTSFVLPRFIVTGPDKRRLQDVPRLRLYANLIIFSAIVILLLLAVMNVSLDLFAFPLVIIMGLLFLFMEKKYLPNTRRHLVTLCWIGLVCVVFGIYAGVAYL